MGQTPEFICTDPEGGHKTDEKHDGAKETKHVHRFLAKRREEPEGEQVEIAVDEAVQSHELRRAVLTGLMLYHLLPDLIEAGILGQIRDIAVHLSIHLDILHHRLAVCFQAAVEVVQVLDTADLPGCRIEELRGQGLRDRVITFLFIS